MRVGSTCAPTFSLAAPLLIPCGGVSRRRSAPRQSGPANPAFTTSVARSTLMPGQQRRRSGIHTVQPRLLCECSECRGSPPHQPLQRGVGSRWARQVVGTALRRPTARHTIEHTRCGVGSRSPPSSPAGLGSRLEGHLSVQGGHPITDARLRFFCPAGGQALHSRLLQGCPRHGHSTLSPFFGGGGLLHTRADTLVANVKLGRGP